MFNRNKKDDLTFETDDMLIVFDDENKTSDIVYITDITEDSVMSAGKYKVPREDCELTNGPNGLIYFYRAPQRSIIETQRLAQLEKNMVLRQITAYNPPEPHSSMDLTKGLLFGLVFIAFIIMGLTSCSGG